VLCLLASMVKVGAVKISSTILRQTPLEASHFISAHLLVFLLTMIALTSVFAARGEGLRNVHGIVRDHVGRPLGGSVVEIEDTLTLTVRSFIVGKDGKYYFTRLNPDVEYSLKVRYRNVWGPKKSLSAFDSRKDAEVDFSVNVSREE
jgi:hypothetical protein